MESVEPAVAPSDVRAGRLLSRRVRELFRVYPKALVGEVEAVHDLRVAARRLRAALGLLVANPEGRRARRADKTLRELARAAGRGRDLDVGLAILEGLPAAASPENLRLRRALSASRSRARFLSREALLDLELAHLRRDLRALLAETRIDRAVLAERLNALRARETTGIERELTSGRARPAPERLHAARRAARRLRYAAEVEALWDGATSDAADRWRKMQSRLGDIQDRHVLAAWLSARERRAAAKDDVTLKSAAARALSRVKRDAARLTREFVRAQSALGEPGSIPPPADDPTAGP
jgi:CHAD domain-containing protein